MRYVEVSLPARVGHPPADCKLDFWPTAYLYCGQTVGFSRPPRVVPPRVEAHFLHGKKDFVRAFFDSAAVSPEISCLLILKIWWTAVGCPLQTELVGDVPALTQTVVIVRHIHRCGSYIAHCYVAVVMCGVVDAVRGEIAAAASGVAWRSTFVRLVLKRHCEYYPMVAPAAVPAPVFCFLSTDQYHVLSLELPIEAQAQITDTPIPSSSGSSCPCIDVRRWRSILW